MKEVLAREGDPICSSPSSVVGITQVLCLRIIISFPAMIGRVLFYKGILAMAPRMQMQGLAEVLMDSHHTC
jgi:hypothetical protein